MFLAIDIGNTTISLGLLKGKKIVKVWSIPVSPKEKNLEVRLQKVLTDIKTKHPLVKNAIICSVAPRILKMLKVFVFKILEVKALVVGVDIKVPIPNKYKRPRQVGQDRLVCAFAAKTLYGQPAIIIDFGTAITLDAVSSSGEYLGGVIVPGIRLTAEALFKKTALLPNVAIEKPRELIGRDTKQSILSGIFYGYGALCDGVIRLMARKLKSRPKIVATGGYVRLMEQFSSQIHLIDPYLVFRGLYLLLKETLQK